MTRQMDLVIDGLVEFATTFLEKDSANPSRMEIPFRLERDKHLKVDADTISGDIIAERVRETKVIYLPTDRELPIRRGDVIRAYCIAKPEGMTSGYDVHHVDVLRCRAGDVMARYFSSRFPNSRIE